MFLGPWSPLAVRTAIVLLNAARDHCGDGGGDIAAGVIVYGQRLQIAVARKSLNAANIPLHQRKGFGQFGVFQDMVSSVNFSLDSN